MRILHAVRFAGVAAVCFLSFNVAAFSQGAAVAEVSAQLSTSKLDSKSAKVGDAVVAKVSSAVKLPDGTEVPKGSKLIGTVTSVHPYVKKGANGLLAVTFDSIQMSGGKTIPVRAILDSVSAMVAHSADDTPGDLSAAPTMAGNGSGSMGAASASAGVGGTVPDGSSPTANNVGAGDVTTGNAIPTNMPGISLSSPAGGTPSGVLYGAGKNVHIESGVLLTLRVAPQS